MSPQPPGSELVNHRGELMAELLLQEMEPQVLARVTGANDVGYDLLAGFGNDQGGINLFAVRVNATERPPPAHYVFSGRGFDRLARSNVPGLLLVTDVKANRVYYAWATPSDALPTLKGDFRARLVAVDEAEKRKLRQRFTGSATVAARPDAVRVAAG